MASKETMMHFILWKVHETISLFLQFHLGLIFSTFTVDILRLSKLHKSKKVSLALYFIFCWTYSYKIQSFLSGGVLRDFTIFIQCLDLVADVNDYIFSHKHTDIYLALDSAFQIYIIIYANNSQSYKTSYTNLKAGYVKHKYYF